MAPDPDTGANGLVRDRGQPGPHAAEPARPAPAPQEVPGADCSQEILEAAKQVAALLKAGDCRFALAGGVAAYAHGVPRRSLHDVDFCILHEDVDDVCQVLAAAGIRVWTPPEDWLLKADCRGQNVDLIMELADRPVTPGLLARAEVRPVDSVRMPVLHPTDLVSGLLDAFSDHHCDFGAVLPIARTLRERIDWAEIRGRGKGKPMSEAFLFLLERLDVIAPADGSSSDAEEASP
ncbi:nucleotidyltransferase family protein [Actinacidiphila paucisporea]|uniref:Uncharacterized nucleotidyltransferase n=1 Tax=Actinacidiphila paucisporea TaxID=310782 RepID=A0A1M7M3Z6_9ACTN|nr:nucleotidyltransferase family protein [Actinacidiphila paucisporea]SHM85292.1 Uncharacterised nucleotidyltransferase [Actinacidiphila paucisporea]